MRSLTLVSEEEYWYKLGPIYTLRQFQFIIPSSSNHLVWRLVQFNGIIYSGGLVAMSGLYLRGGGGREGPLVSFSPTPLTSHYAIELRPPLFSILQICPPWQNFSIRHCMY